MELFDIQVVAESLFKHGGKWPLKRKKNCPSTVSSLGCMYLEKKENSEILLEVHDFGSN